MADWLLPYEERRKLRKDKTGFKPDICGRCGIVFGRTLGGRLREFCPFCVEDDVYQNHLLKYWWGYYVATELGIPKLILEGYLAEALVYYGDARERRKQRFDQSG